MTNKRLLLVLSGLTLGGAQLHAAPTTASAVPSNAKAGECYARQSVDAVYRPVSKKVLVSERSEKVVIKPAVYKTVTEKVLLSPATQKVIILDANGRPLTGKNKPKLRLRDDGSLEIVPNSYQLKTRRIKVQDARTEYKKVAATYRTEKQKILIKPARTVWKTDDGKIFGLRNAAQAVKINQETGSVMCLVEEPAVYKTVSKKIVVTPASTRKIEIPPKYKTVKVNDVDQLTIKTVRVPAKYQTVTKKVIAKPASKQRITIPAKYTTVTKKELVHAPRVSWIPVLCDVNLTTEKLKAIQTALRNAGFNPGPIDGKFGRKTVQAIKQYQRRHRLTQSAGINIETIEHLGVNIY